MEPLNEEVVEDRRKKVARIVARAWSDPEFKARLLANPEEELTKAGLPVPEGLTVKMHEDSDRIEHGVIPKPPKGLTREELANPENVHIVYCFTAYHHS